MPSLAAIGKADSLGLKPYLELHTMLNSLINLLKRDIALGNSRLTLSLLTASATFFTIGQAYAVPDSDKASLLLPLEVGKLPTHQLNMELSLAADNINKEFAASQNSEPEPDVLLPVVGELLNEKGKFDWGMDIPVTFDFGDLVGNPVLIVGTDFSTD